MRITPLDIRQQQFTVKMFRGFDVQEVDTFLEDLAADYENLLKEARGRRVFPAVECGEGTEQNGLVGLRNTAPIPARARSRTRLFRTERISGGVP